MRVAVALQALSEPIRRDLFERLVVRPRRVGDLAGETGVSESSIAYHLNILEEAGLVRHDARRFSAVAEELVQLRLYFDRLWLEASLGDSWLRERGLFISDHGL